MIRNLRLKKINKDDLSNGKKEFYSLIDLFVEGILQEGIHVFSLNINLLKEKELFDNPSTEYNTTGLNCITYTKNMLKDYKLKEYEVISNKLGIYKEIDELVIRCYSYISFLLSDIPFIDSLIGSFEFSKKNNIPHIHCILIFRKVNDDYSKLKYTINKCLNESTCINDYFVDYLAELKNIKNYFKYFTKEFNSMRNNNQFIISLFSKINYENHYSLFLEKLYKLKLFNKGYNKLITINEFMIQDLTDNFFANQDGINTSSNTKIDKTLVELAFYLNLYFIFKKIIIYKNNIYQKIENSIISYKYLGDENYLSDNIINFIDYILDLIIIVNKKSAFNFMLVNKKNVILILENLKSFSEKIKFNHDIIEFRDGIYICYYNKYIEKNTSKKIIEEISYKYKTIRYYDKSYKSIIKRGFSNLCWKNLILKQFNNNMNEFKEFITIFNEILFDNYSTFSNIVDSKKRTLFILGESNTGKTTLVSKFLLSVYGHENTGSISNNLIFMLENVNDKDLIVCDEVELNKNNRSLILKLTGGESLLVSKKYKDSIFKCLNAKIIFSSNYTIETNDFLKDKAFKNRIKLIIFNEVLKLNKEVYNNLNIEIPEILLYCNRLTYKERLKNNLKTFKKNNLINIEH